MKFLIDLVKGQPTGKENKPVAIVNKIVNHLKLVKG